MSLRDAVRARFDVAREIGDELIVTCPSPDHADRNPSAAINVRKGLWVCYSCGARGTLEKLLGTQWVDPDVDDMLADIDELLDDGQVPIHPESWLDQFDVAGVHPYWRSRGLTELVCREFRLGYDPTTARATIPLRSPRGDVWGVIRRATDTTSVPRYRYPESAPVSRTLFGYERVRHGVFNITITEGALDAIAMCEAGMRAVAQLGSSLSDHQVELLRQLGPTSITLAYDQDPAGRRARRRVLENPMLKDFDITVMSWDRSLGKDPLDLVPEQRRDIWRHSREVRSVW